MEHRSPAEELAACSASFGHFLRHWRYINREAGTVQTFETLWDGQRDAVDEMERYPWLILLKAGKLGFTELECAYDGWVTRFGRPNARVHLFSMDAPAAKSLLEVVRFGMDHLPQYMRLPIIDNEPGGDTSTQVRYAAGPDDRRTIKSYAAVRNVAIDQTATHSHVDELARMPWPEDTWSAIESTVAPGGTVHIVSRGKGDQNYMGVLYRKAERRDVALRPFFAGWDKRPRYPTQCPECGDVFHAAAENAGCAGVDQERASAAWYAEKESSLTTLQLYFLAPRSPDEALASDAESAYVPIERWNACYDPDLPPLRPGMKDPIVLAMDAAVTDDSFAIVGVGRHPADHDTPAIRLWRAWRPQDYPGGEIPLHEVDAWVRTICVGGCATGQHPNIWHGRPSPEPGCPQCEAGDLIEPLNVVQICYDRFQLKDMMQSLTRDEIAWCWEFDQNALRLVADGALRKRIMTRTVRHGLNPEVASGDVFRQHVENAGAKIDSREDTKLRIVKRGAGKIDLVVAASMGVHQAMYLDI